MVTRSVFSIFVDMRIFNIARIQNKLLFNSCGPILNLILDNRHESDVLHKIGYIQIDVTHHPGGFELVLLVTTAYKI